MKRKKPGRKPLPEAQRRSARITFRATTALRKALEEKSKKEKKTLGTYIVSVLQSAIQETR